MGTPQSGGGLVEDERLHPEPSHGGLHLAAGSGDQLLREEPAVAEAEGERLVGHGEPLTTVPATATGTGLPLPAPGIYLGLPESTETHVGDVAQLLQYVSEHIIRSQLVRRRNPDGAERLDRYIDDHIGERLTLGGLARAIHVSPSFLSHRAAAELGRPPLKHVAEKRLQLARERLRAGGSVHEVASDLGFYDAFHFSRRFKARFGCAPTRYASGATSRP
jgi:AraC-like DNA-binding protein